MINFPFGTNGKSIILGVPILKHITVYVPVKDQHKSDFTCNPEQTAQLVP